MVTTVPEGLPPPAIGPVTAATGGASFNTAPAVSPGTYRDVLSTGETRYYKVHLEWGQRLTYQVVLDQVSGLGHESGYARTAIGSPLRQELALSSTGNAARGFGGPESVAMTGSTLVPVQYANRGSDRSDIRSYSLAGDYYLSVGLSYPVDAVPFRTGISVSVDVVGQREPGPRYAPTPLSEPAGESAPLTRSGPVDQSTPATPSSDHTGVLWLTVAVVIVAGAIGVLVVLRRRSNPKR